jgi:hypothetical protein
LVHLADERSNPGLGELANAVAKDSLVFREDREWLDVVEGL